MALELAICPKVLVHISEKYYSEKPVSALGGFIACNLVIVSGLLEWTEIGNMHLDNIQTDTRMNHTTWVLRLVIAWSLFNFNNLTSVRFPLCGISTILSSHQVYGSIFFGKILGKSWYLHVVLIYIFFLLSKLKIM